jgi:hypothetical protein
MLNNTIRVSNANVGIFSNTWFKPKFSPVVIVAVAALALLALAYFVFNREAFHRLTRNCFKTSTPPRERNALPQPRTDGSTRSHTEGSTSSPAQVRVSAIVRDLFLTPDINGDTDLDNLHRMLNQIKTIIASCPEGSAYKGNRYYQSTMQNLELTLGRCSNPQEVQIEDLTSIVHNLRSLGVFVRHFSEYALGRGLRNTGHVISVPVDGSDEPMTFTYKDFHENYITEFLNKLTRRRDRLGEALNLTDDWYRKSDEDINRMITDSEFPESHSNKEGSMRTPPFRGNRSIPTPPVEGNGSIPTPPVRGNGLIPTPSVEGNGSMPKPPVCGNLSMLSREKISEIVQELFLKEDVDGDTDLNRLKQLVNQIKRIIEVCPEGSAYKGHRAYDGNISSLERALDNCLNPAGVQIRDLTDIVHSLRMLSVYVKHFSDYALGRGSRNPGQVVSLQIDGSDEPVVATYKELHESYIADFLGKLTRRTERLGEALGLSEEWYRLSSEAITKALEA